MNPILSWGVDLIAAIQAAAPWLSSPMLLFSFLGNEEFLLILLPFLFWCVDAGLGVRVGIILCISQNTNRLFKLVFQQPRPYWISPKVTAMSAESSFGLPSGHAQNALSVWGLIASQAAHWRRWLLAAVIPVIGFSRIVVAVHFPTDVLVGWFLGGILLAAFLAWDAPITAWIKRQGLWTQIGVGAAVSVALLVVGLIGMVFAPVPEIAAWDQAAAQAWAPEAGEPAIDPRNPDSAFSVAGAFLGMVVGVALLFRQTHFDTRVSLWKRALRYGLGIIGVLVLYLGLRAIFPSDATFLAYALRYLRYALIGAWIGYGAPRMFLKMGI